MHVWKTIAGSNNKAYAYISCSHRNSETEEKKFFFGCYYCACARLHTFFELYQIFLLFSENSLRSRMRSSARKICSAALTRPAKKETETTTQKCCERTQKLPGTKLYFNSMATKSFRSSQHDGRVCISNSEKFSHNLAWIEWCFCVCASVHLTYVCPSFIIKILLLLHRLFSGHGASHFSLHERKSSAPTNKVFKTGKFSKTEKLVVGTR